MTVMFIKVTAFDTGRTQWINVAHILGFERSEDGEATGIKLVGVGVGFVKETPLQILGQIRGD